ncbi:MAG TPA: protoporphyrinogen oxidase [Candidatus Acidoferrales bacterium]|nr:protoporphyrinogen oxidase [Candidatus Acidoferrales bacterium]
MSRRIVVVGGGIAGLAAAHRLIELSSERSLGLEVTLLEASPRLGGSIASERMGDFLIEAGPDSFITEKPYALRLCERLGLRPRLVSTQAAYQKINIVHKGKLVPLPEGFFLLAPTRFWPFVRTPLFSWSGKLRMAAELFLPRGIEDGEESLGSFVRRRFGAEALARVAQPLVGGIYASDPEKLSLAATMPRFQEMEQQKRSVIWAMWSEQRRRARMREAGSGARWSLFVTLTAGMQELVETIAQKLPEGVVRLNSAVTTLDCDNQGHLWHVGLANEKLNADAIILATPAFHAAEMLSTTAGDAAVDLKNIEYASTATVSLAYRSADLPRALDSFGFVVPALERRKIMACTFSSLKYPGRAPPNHVLLRAFVGGSLQPELFQDDDATMEKNVRAELAELLGIEAPPLLARVYRYPNSMPQYHVGHQERIQRIETGLAKFPNLALAGGAYHGVGISDCVRTGEEAAEKVISQVLT